MTSGATPVTPPAAPAGSPRPARACALAFLILAAASCAPAERRESPATREESAGIRFEPARFSDLRGWAGDDHRAALAAFVKSCRWLLRHGAGQFGRAADWRPVCREARAVGGARPGRPEILRAQLRPGPGHRRGRQSGRAGHRLFRARAPRVPQARRPLQRPPLQAPSGTDNGRSQPVPERSQGPPGRRPRGQRRPPALSRPRQHRQGRARQPRPRAGLGRQRHRRVLPADPGLGPGPPARRNRHAAGL